MKWFEEEQKLFQKNSSLIRFALEKAEADQQRGEYQSQYYKAMEEIYLLEQEMKNAIVRHGELLQACMDLQKKADELVFRSKLQALRPTFDFGSMVQSLMEQDRADKLEYLIEPFLKLNVRKTFPLRMIDEMLTYRPEKEETAEAVTVSEEQDYIYEDEVEENRIGSNFRQIAKLLLDKLLEKGEFTLQEFCKEQGARYGRTLMENGDFYTFLVHLCQKKEYDMQEVRSNPDTFLEEILCKFLDQDENEKYRNMKLSMEMLPDSVIASTGAVSITDIHFQVKE